MVENELMARRYDHVFAREQNASRIALLFEKPQAMNQAKSRIQIQRAVTEISSELTIAVTRSLDAL